MTTILAVLTDPETAPAVLTAAAVAAAVDDAASIEALHVRVASDSLIMPTEEVMTARRRAELDARLAERARLIEGVFEAWAKTAGAQRCRAAWHEMAGSVAAAVAARGARVDLLVLGRPREHAGRDALHAAIFASGRLFLLVPPDLAAPVFGRHMAIAWKASDTAERAVVAALPWLRRAGRISVLIAGADADPQARPLLARLAADGIPAAKVALAAVAGEQDDGVGAALLATARTAGADCLVMGAYRRHRLVEWVLGGVTRHVLEHADLPAFMLH